MSYSFDYRQRVMKIKGEEDLTFDATSKRFGVGIATLFRWKKKPEPQKTRNKPATKVNMESLKADVQKNSDAYLSERAERLGVSVSGIFYALKRLNMSYKKNSISPKS
ncbi:MAG: IS630 transposase-related protein [Candidatus Moraniibacteriota bacterium]